MQMCRDRGFEFPECYDSITDSEILLLRDNNRLDWTTNNEAKTKFIYAKFVPQVKVTSSNIRASFPYIKAYFENRSIPSHKLDVIFIIYHPPARIDELEKEYDLGGSFHIYSFKQLQINPTEHLYVPKHIPLNESEVALLRKLYSLQTLAQLQLILSSDPIVRWYNFAPDTVLKIVPKLGLHDSRFRVVKKI